MVLRALIVDDHVLTRAGVRVQLEACSDIVVVGEASNGRDAVERAAELRPDLVVTDLTMPFLNGIDSARKIRELLPHVKIIAVTMRSDARTVAEVLRIGASGFVLKTGGADELMRAVDAVRAGHVYLSPTVADSVVDVFVRSNGTILGSDRAPLSSREREVLQMIAEGVSTKEIASELCVSVKTVESHRRQIMGKLHIRSVAELTKYAVREGITSAEK